MFGWLTGKKVSEEDLFLSRIRFKLNDVMRFRKLYGDDISYIVLEHSHFIQYYKQIEKPVWSILENFDRCTVRIKQKNFPGVAGIHDVHIIQLGDVVVEIQWMDGKFRETALLQVGGAETELKQVECELLADAVRQRLKDEQKLYSNIVRERALTKIKETLEV